MLDLFKTNSDICTRMAAAATSPEVRQQWSELATHWRMKADANKLQANGPQRQAVQVEVGRLSPKATKKLEQVVSNAPKGKPDLRFTATPALVPNDERAALAVR